MLKILIVDDSLFSQKVTSNLLKKFLDPIDIYYAADGEAGFEKYKEINPDYVFLDLLMPKINGLNLIPMIKEYDTNAKIFVISADVQKTVREEVELYHILSFVNKPFTEEKAQAVYSVIKEKLR